MNPAEWLQRAAARFPQHPALLRGETVVADYAEFASRAAALASGLSGQTGIGPGDRVAVFANNATEYLIALYGIWWAGAAAVPINAKLHPREAAFILGDCECSLLFCDDTHQAEIAALLPDLPLVSFGGEAWRDLLASSAANDPHPMQAQELVWLFYTSGTTGKPKGVMLEARNIEAMTLSYFSDVDAVAAEDAALYAAPLSHGAGLYNFMHVIKGARHVVPESGGFDAREVLSLAADIDRVSMFAAPTMVRRLVDAAREHTEPGKGIKTIVYGGGPMYSADILEAVEIMGPRFVQIYGQGECPMCITALSRAEICDRTHARWRERLGSVGRAQSVVRLRIADEEGRPLGHGEVGEILVQGQPVMRGYWKNDAETAKALRNGWLWTGDLGSLDEDGYLTLHDRSKDMIISGGSNIYPREIEEVLLEHAQIREASVIGRNDPEWGEVVVAYVVGEASPDTLDQHCLDRIARFKRPKAYVFVEQLPKNNYGKVLKTELRRMDAEATQKN